VKDPAIVLASVTNEVTDAIPRKKKEEEEEEVTDAII